MPKPRFGQKPNNAHLKLARAEAEQATRQVSFTDGRCTLEKPAPLHESDASHLHGASWWGSVQAGSVLAGVAGRRIVCRPLCGADAGLHAQGRAVAVRKIASAGAFGQFVRTYFADCRVWNWARYISAMRSNFRLRMRKSTLPSWGCSPTQSRSAVSNFKTSKSGAPG